MLYITAGGLHIWYISYHNHSEFCVFLCCSICLAAFLGFSTFISQVKSVWLPLADMLQILSFILPMVILNSKIEWMQLKLVYMSVCLEPIYS